MSAESDKAKVESFLKINELVSAAVNLEASSADQVLALVMFLRVTASHLAKIVGPRNAARNLVLEAHHQRSHSDYVETPFEASHYDELQVQATSFGDIKH